MEAIIADDVNAANALTAQVDPKGNGTRRARGMRMNDGSGNGNKIGGGITGGKILSAPRHSETRVVTGGRDPRSNHGFVNPPVYHASTVLYPSAEDFLAHRARYQYGRRGTPTTEALENALAELEGLQCAGVALLPSGLAAISAAFLSVVRTGDHLLVTDSAYGPTRNFCEQMLTRLGVTTTYYDPLIGAGIAELFQPNTRAVFLESPGSLSFEMQDVPAIAKAAHEKGALVLMDNTWATPLYFRPLEHGVDLAIQAGTKYIGGHSDVMLGTVAANATSVTALKNAVRLCGLCEGPDDVYLGLRGLRTLAVRLERHYKSGLAVARWLEQRPEVLRLLHPALPSHPGHAIWRRDFSGACGLFSMVLKPVPQKAVYAFLDTLELFGIGASWGGYESLAIPFDCTPLRTAIRWAPGGPTVRFHIGLEAVDDLIADLEHAFAVMAAAI
jgi:cystathionine beta-lyase